MAGESAPTPTFKTEATPSKPKIQEKIPVIRTIAEKAKQRGEKKAERAAQPRLTPARVGEIRAERKAQGRSPFLNLSEDTMYQSFVKQEEAKLASAGNLQTELVGGIKTLGPSEKAQAQSQAYERYKVKYPDTAEQYCAAGIYLKQAPDGMFVIDYSADPFMRTVDQQVRVLQQNGQEQDAQAILDQFAQKYKGKASLYAQSGHKGLRDSLTRIDLGVAQPVNPDASAGLVGQTNAPEAAATVTPAEQLKADLKRYSDLSARPPASMSFAERNEMRQLHKAHEGPIASAQILADKFNNDPNMILQQTDLDRLEQYKAFLKTPDAAPPAPNAPTPAELQAQQKAQEAAEKRRLGTEGYGKLTDMGVDLSLGEAEILAKLSRGEITGPDGTWQNDAATQEYIRLAFVRQKEIDDVILLLPQAERDKLKGLGPLLAAILAFAAKEAFDQGVQAAQAAKQP